MSDWQIYLVFMLWVTVAGLTAFAFFYLRVKGKAEGESFLSNVMGIFLMGVYIGFFPALGVSFGVGGAWLGLLSLVSQNNGKGFFQLASENLSSFLFVVSASMPLIGIIWLVGSAKLALGMTAKGSEATPPDV